MELECFCDTLVAGVFVLAGRSSQRIGNISTHKMCYFFAAQLRGPFANTIPQKIVKYKDRLRGFFFRMYSTLRRLAGMPEM